MTAEVEDGTIYMIKSYKEVLPQWY
jgi:hypothetical protein